MMRRRRRRRITRRTRGARTRSTQAYNKKKQGAKMDNKKGKDKKK